MPFKTITLYSLLLLSGLLFCLAQEHITDGLDQYRKADDYFSRAEKLVAKPGADDATLALQDQLNLKSLAIFKSIIDDPHTTVSDSILFHCCFKAGLLSHYFDSLAIAKLYYAKAIALKPKIPALPDSFLFQPYLFTGSIFYSDNAYDSALAYYKKAEQVADGYAVPLSEGERLYNRLGALHYEMGNYRLANNYFQKALKGLSPSNPSYADLLVNYKMNIASIAIKMQAFSQADTMLSSILHFKQHLPEIYHNLGIVALRTGRYKAALDLFSRTGYTSKQNRTELYYNIAESFNGLQQSDSARFYIDKALAQSNIEKGPVSNTVLGLIYGFIAKQQALANQAGNALAAYQRSIGYFYPAFKDSNVYSTPTRFSGIFSYINLFRALVEKAELFEKIYRQTNDLQQLEASVNSYRSAFKLTDYVAGTYNSDEARLFLDQLRYAEHNKAIDAALLLYEQTKSPQYLEDAYEFDQKNKAAALTQALDETKKQKKAGVPEALLAQRSALQSGITRLSLRASKINDNAGLNAINSEITDKEILLAKNREQVNKYTKTEEQHAIPSLPELKEMLDDKTALLSYHISDSSLIIFFVQHKGFGYTRIPAEIDFTTGLQAYIQSLHAMDAGQRYDGSALAKKLYHTLVEPLSTTLAGMQRLIIIPDDELNYLPFESLENNKGEYLLQSFAVQYQYSTALLNPVFENGNLKDQPLLGFAPFAGTGTNTYLPALPHSAEELQGLKGQLLYNKDATLNRFMEHANHYPVIQLATHATANDSFPQRSYIAFYAKPGEPADQSLLYAQEIYDLNLDSTKLIILSACETGSGKLVKGEGLMSLTRAFAYAGCPNIITSLWNAADRSTAYITRHFHTYLDKGFTLDRSLQLAKLDLLKDNTIPPALKTPNYWSQLIFIGSYQRENKNTFNWYWLLLLPVITLMLLAIKKVLQRGRT